MVSLGEVKNHEWLSVFFSDTCVRRFLDNVSIVGFKEMSVPGQWPVRFIWMLIFCMCVMSTGYFIYKTMLEYLKDPTATKVSLLSSYFLLEVSFFFEFPPPCAHLRNEAN